MPAIIENLKIIEDRISAACRKAGRSREEIRIVAVTKTQNEDRIREAAEAGLRLFAESRVQEAQRKLPALKSLGEWHFIGHLQTNKAKNAVDMFDSIESVDSLRLAREISRLAAGMDRRIDVWAEVNVSGEGSKQGFPLDSARDEIGRMLDLPGLKLSGLMTMAPRSDSEEEARPVFSGLRRLARSLEGRAGALGLSMGMSDDYRVAVEEGATHVRIGSALFR